MKYADKKIKVPIRGSIIKLYYPGFYPFFAQVVYHKQGQVCAEGIAQWKDDKTVSKVELQLNHPAFKKSIKDKIKWKEINQSGKIIPIFAK